MEALGRLKLAWVRKEDLPAGIDWLSLAERAALARLKIDKRRREWLMGRWAGRLAALAALGEQAAPLHILPDEDGRPRVTFIGDEAEKAAHAPSLSLSHAAGVAFAVADPKGRPTGCDVEAIEVRSDAFVSDYFLPEERAAVRAAAPELRPVVANLIWSAKESALKVMGVGLRADTRSVCVEMAGPLTPRGRWSPLVVQGGEGRIFRGHWRVRDGLVWTVLTAPTY